MEEEHPESRLRMPSPAPPAPPVGSAADPSPPTPGSPSRIPADRLRPDYRRLLPARGILAGGGGLVSTTWRVVVDLDTGRLTAARNDDAGGRVFGSLAHSKESELSHALLTELRTLAGDLLQDDETPQTVLTADSMGVLIIVDQDQAYELVPAGPITRGPAAELHTRLYRLAWNDG